VLVAGLFAFNFWEPMADVLEPVLHGYADAVCLVFLFGLALGLLWLATHRLAGTVVAFHPRVQQAGGALFGAVTGYLASGFLVCVLQTLPWHEHFLGIDGGSAEGESALRGLLPPDRAWLALMRRAGAYPLSNRVDEAVPEPADLYDTYITFDKYSTFELRYQRYRRYGDHRDPLPYHGELDAQLHQR
jgi:hypothetical protein